MACLFFLGECYNGHHQYHGEIPGATMSTTKLFKDHNPSIFPLLIWVGSKMRSELVPPRRRETWLPLKSADLTRTLFAWTMTRTTSDLKFTYGDQLSFYVCAIVSSTFSRRYIQNETRCSSNQSARCLHEVKLPTVQTSTPLSFERIALHNWCVVKVITAFCWAGKHPSSQMGFGLRDFGSWWSS